MTDLGLFLILLFAGFSIIGAVGGVWLEFKVKGLQRRIKKLEVKE